MSNENSLNLPFSDISSKNENKESKNINRQILKTIFRTQYIRNSLFPFKYYLCSIFIKNFDLKKNIVFYRKNLLLYMILFVNYLIFHLILFFKENFKL